MLKNKKGGVPISVGIVVFLTLALIIFTLVSFNSQTKSFAGDLSKILIIDNIYAQEEIINFNIQDITNKVSKKSNNEQEFINNFNKELENYKHAGGKYVVLELSQLEDQLNVDNVVFDNSFTIPFSIEITEKHLEEGISIEYRYTKTFISK